MLIQVLKMQNRSRIEGQILLESFFNFKLYGCYWKIELEIYYYFFLKLDHV